MVATSHKLPVAMFATAVLLFHLEPITAAGDSIEFNIKAAYLLNFARYVYWPHTAGAEPSTPLIVGILGHDQTADILERIIAGKSINGRPLRLKFFSPAAKIDKCDVLFVPRSESKNVAPVLLEILGRPTLTVSDKEGFVGQGGMIEFLLVDDTVRFTINNKAVENAGLKLNSELLRVAYSIAGGRK